MKRAALTRTWASYSLSVVAACVVVFFPFLSRSAGLGGSGGGPRAETVVKEEVCTGGESGTLCHTVIYRVRPSTGSQPETCTVFIGEGGEVPCPTSGEIPEWLRRLRNRPTPKPVERDIQMYGGG